MTDLVASYRHEYAPKDGRQKLAYWVFDRELHTHAFVTLDVDCDWLRKEASLNDLKQMAIAEATR